MNTSNRSLAQTLAVQTRCKISRDGPHRAGVFGLERQHSVPLLLHSGSGGAEPLKPIAQQGGGDAVSEAYIQALVHEHPACLPIAEIDAMFSGPVPICTELNTPAGPIDNFRQPQRTAAATTASAPGRGSTLGADD